MAVIGNGTANELACYSGTQQTATTCSTATASLLGVFFTTFANGSPGGSVAVIAPPGRATVASSTSGLVWTAGWPVCRDTANLGFATSSGSPCPIGQAVGVAVGDLNPNALPTHAVDLDFSDQGVGSSGTSTIYATADTTVGMAPAGGVLVTDSSGDAHNSGITDGFTTTPYIPQVTGAVNVTNTNAAVAATAIYPSAPVGEYALQVYVNQVANCTTTNGTTPAFSAQVI
ncbi:MAG: hypothetical protein WBX38_18945 [Candidatus Sulfotelmatobacter sp.]